MLIEKLNQINNILLNLLEITQKDINYIKNAEHEKIFENIPKKEKLSMEFAELKGQIDEILIQRNKPVDEIFTEEEEKIFEKFKTLLNEFNEKHRYFSKLSFIVANFYNVLTDKIKKRKKITYNNDSLADSYLKLKA